jgi:glutathione reductase (NADPH)
VTRFDEYAHFIDANTMQVGDRVITADKILIATGGRPRYPSFKGAEHALVSDDMFSLEKFPDHIVIQGGGYIAVEFAHIFHGLGAQVTLLYRKDMFLNGFDNDLRAFLRDEMIAQGIHIHFNCDIEEIEKTDRLAIRTNNGLSVECDTVLSAIGRTPEIGKLCLGQAGIAFEESGRIPVNENFQTNVPHIYAVGDVTNKLNLTPIALAEGHALADNLFNKQRRTIHYDYVPTAVFSRPAMATCGLTEEQARAQGMDVTLYKSTFKPMKNTLSNRNERFFIKLIVNKADDRVVGLHMAGEDAPEILQGFAVAMKMGATKADFDACIGIHPTAAEELVTLRTPSST